MAPLDDTTAATRFDSFDVYRTPYKTIGDHKIEAGILVPKNLKPGKHPLVVKFHGGGLVVGDGLYAAWIGSFFVPFLHRNSAITVLPNYRLTPEATGDDILEDLADFWTWFHGHGVDKFLTSQNVSVELDYERLLVTGDSAGGYMTLQSGLTRPKGEIKAMLLQYPMTTHLTRDPTQKTMGAGPLPKKTLDDYIAAMTPGKVVSSSIPATDLTRLGLSLSLNSYNRFNEFFGTGKHLWPITAVEDANFLPPMTIFHGGQDTVVPLEHTELFIDKMKGLDQLKGTEIRLAVIDGEEHGFDTAIKEDEQAWLKVELEWVEGKWLA